MIIDTHCHFDMMPSPEKYIREVEFRGDYVIGMTNLPSHFEMGFAHTRNYKHVRLALGFHPQLAADNQNELQRFIDLIDRTSYIGEIGLDFSRDYIGSKEIQISSIRTLLSALRGKKKIVSIHSRRAEIDVFKLLCEYGIKNAIFHWYSGPVSLISQIAKKGYYFSINEAMIMSENGRRIISAIPSNRILAETDAPYNRKCNLNKVYDYFGPNVINDNFNALINEI